MFGGRLVGEGSDGLGDESILMCASIAVLPLSDWHCRFGWGRPCAAARVSGLLAVWGVGGYGAVRLANGPFSFGLEMALGGVLYGTTKCNLPSLNQCVSCLAWHCSEFVGTLEAAEVSGGTASLLAYLRRGGFAYRQLCLVSTLRRRKNDR